MTRGDLARVSFLGRPVKPFAFALTISMLWLTAINISHAGIFGETLLGELVAVAGFSSAVLLTVGWAMGAQRLAEIGLLAATFVWMARGLFAIFTDPIGAAPYGWGLSFCMAIATGGAYMLEVTDRLNPVDRPASPSKG